MDAITILVLSTAIALIGWLGSRIVSKQDELMAKQVELLEKLGSVKEEIHTRVNHLGIRLARVETRVGMK